MMRLGGPNWQDGQTREKENDSSSVGDVVEFVELLCLAILSTPREGGKTEGKSRDTIGGTAWCNDSDGF